MFFPYVSPLHFFSILTFYGKYFILLEDKLLALSPVDELYAKTRKKIKIATCHHKFLNMSSEKPRPFIIKYWPAIMKISTIHTKISTVTIKTLNIHNKTSICHHENLDLSSWISQPVVILKISTYHNKISTCHHENLRPVIKNTLAVNSKILTYHHENLKLFLSWKSRSFIIKSRPFIMQISAIHNKISSCYQKRLDRS